MAIVYVKAYFDWIEQTAALSDAERGRLFISILEYARSGVYPKLDGRESILFPVFKSQVDRDKASANASAENGKKGGRPKTKENLDKPNLTKENLTKGNKDKEKEKDNNKDKDKEDNYTDSAELNVAIDAFIKHRKQMKKPMTDNAVALLIAKLNKMTPDVREQVKIIEQSILNGWSGVFELKDNNSKSNGKLDVLAEWREAYD